MRYIPFKRHTLSNGLRLIVHEDATTPLATVNIIYKVGSRDEKIPHTGLAHLLEHLMFTGSKHVDNFDTHLQRVGAINNAYTSQDITNYYITLPAQNLETALWLESDRMMALNLDEKSFMVQKQVVIEEFKESFLNKPYGDMWLQFKEFVFEKHPYKWLPIGLQLSHIEEVDLETLRNFYHTYYQPNNAVISIAGNVQFEEVVASVEKWFGTIPNRGVINRDYPQEEVQLSAKKLSVAADVPYPIIMTGWKMGGRTDANFYACDLLSDMLGNGHASFLFQEFAIKNKLFTDINSYITATFDPGLLVLSARPAPNVDLEEAHLKINQFLANFENIDLEYALQKVKNNVTSLILKNGIKAEDRASVLGISETISGVEDFEDEIEKYHAVTEAQIREITRNLFSGTKDNTLFYGVSS